MSPHCKSLPLMVTLLQSVFTFLFGILSTFFESTYTFVIAAFIGFSFNILAGFRADKVKFVMWRLCNFKGNKFKDSLVELFLIVSITYILKLLSDLMEFDENKGVIMVRWLMVIAVYSYMRNGLRNLSIAYPKSRWIRFVYFVVSFQFNELAPEFIKKAWDKSKDTTIERD